MASADSMLPPATPAPKNPNPIPSSSPAFATPAHPIRLQDPAARRHPSAFITTANTDDRVAENSPPPQPVQAPRAAHVLPISLPPTTLRPIAFRTFTKKHNLTLTSSALAALASFVGKNCGQKWREEGLAELVLEEIARSWKKADGRVIVDANDAEGGPKLKGILKTLEGSMSGGRIVGASTAGIHGGLSRHDSFLGISDRPGMDRTDSNESFGMSGLDVGAGSGLGGDEEDQEGHRDVRQWLKVVGAAEQPRMVYHPSRKQFERSRATASLFPDPAQKTELFKQRYHLFNQRILRNESFQAPTIARSKNSATPLAYQLTSIANLLGRSGSGHLLLGLLSVSPAGTLAINDLTGSIMLDLEQALPFNDIDTWLCPGMIVLVDGIYEEEYNPAGGKLGNIGGIGGTLGGRFVGFSIGAPRCETRAETLGLSDPSGADIGIISGGFGWVDFLGVGSERALGSKMQKIERRLLHDKRSPTAETTGRNKIVMLGEVNLDIPMTLPSLRAILGRYADSASDEVPTSFVLMGSFISHAAMSSPASHSAATSVESDTSSIAYKEHFDALAAVLADFPVLLRNSTFIFVPGDNDPWPSASTAGAATAVPRNAVPEMFTSRIKRAFASANANTDPAKDKKTAGEAIWTSNPSRLTLFGPSQEIAFFRDDVSGRLRRNAITLKKQQQQEPDGGEDAVMSGALPSEATQAADTNSNGMDVDGDGGANGARQKADGPVDQAKAHARRLTKTLLDQSHLSPFPLATRPVHWSYAHALSLYPLPSALVLCDAEAEAFALVYQGCCVVNPGKLISPAGSGGGKTRARWIEYDIVTKRGKVKELMS
ncbi:hypothetical protein FH972_023007 [Carpinus fangiana]|uniref:DNA polymerase II subunit 2 n=1 Tax=Carpinus fangiana TaxID=176857 RepID=A0A5N6KW65_9ROSI|nr:hypothetical protein FH972_023007 [Carpinus fangiana]